MTPPPPESSDKPLFTPGPLTTSRTVKEAMLRDLGSRDPEFIAVVRGIRRSLLSVAGVKQPDEFAAVPMQGSGTFGLEAVIASTIPPNGKLLVLANGAYGDRIAKIAAVLRIDTTVLRTSEDATLDPQAVDRALKGDPTITNVAMVHCETTTGIMNPVDEIGRLVKNHNKTYIVDSMSAFGAVPLNPEESGIDYLISSSNKCIEGVPGFSFVICRLAALQDTAGWARSLSFDLLAQWEALESNGQFRFTPPTHSLLAFEQALRELEEEGGVEGRAKRYAANHKRLIEGMRTLGFQEYLPAQLQSYIITSFRYPEHSNFHFEGFYSRLSDKGFVIYPGKVSNANCFRIGSIGRLDERDFTNLLQAITETLREMNIDIKMSSR